MNRLTVGVPGGMGPAATIDSLRGVLTASAAATDRGGIRMSVDHDLA